MKKMLMILLIFLTFLRFQSAVSSSCNQTFIYGYSIKGDEFSTKYKHTLNNFLGSLSSQASKSAFYNISTSTQIPNNEQLYGLYLCRGDVDHQTCRDCVNNAKQDILKRYPYGKETLAWYDQCMVRYANKPIFGKLDLKAYSIIRDDRKIEGDQFGFRRILDRTMRGLAKQAAFGRPEKKFAARAVKFTRDQSLYGLVQCTPDLDPADCHRCLMKAIAYIRGMGSSISVKVMYLNCMARYESFPVPNTDAIMSSEPPSPKAIDYSKVFQISVQVQTLPLDDDTVSSSISKPSIAMDNSPTFKLRAKIKPSPFFNDSIKAKLSLRSMVIKNFTVIKQKGHEADNKASE